MKKTCFIRAEGFNTQEPALRRGSFRAGLLIIPALLVAAMLIACGSSPAGTASGPVSTPDWLNDFPPEDVIWGVGSARQTSVSMSMTTAEARARVSIARQLDNKVQAMFTDYNLDAGNAGAQANASMQEDVSRQITNINLSGARPIKRWQGPDGTWWYLVEYSKSSAKTAVASILGNEEAAFAQFKAQQALDILDQQLAKSEKPVLVNQ
ncbi:MAG: LPP20 family lipoprotein [Treponema sp.]|jgi:hypothetical protein|nr:LPP20 family lipoprotein [Treponema sp.]